MNSQNPLSGILIINKPQGWTSFDVVAKTRKTFNIKKVGHTGTLDPMATGVLLVCLGRATKLMQYMVKDEKEYVAEITLGATSNTDDAEGDLTEVKDPKEPSETELLSVIDEFVGEIDQMPPQFSAKKIKGKKAYELARQGKVVDLKPSRVTIHSIKLMDYKWPKFKIHVHCSSGTYIRSLARDIGEKLGTGGYLSSIIRTRVGNFNLTEAVPMETMNQNSILPMSKAVEHLPQKPLSEGEYRLLKNGRILTSTLPDGPAIGTQRGEVMMILKVEQGRMNCEKVLK